MKRSPQKFVLLSDVVGSRNIRDRRGFEKKLAATLKAMQQQHHSVFEMPIQVWKGLDETAAMLKQPWKLYELMDAMDEAIAPAKIRFVLVKETVDVMPQHNAVAEADGAAFHLAATRMLDLKKSGLKFTCSTGNDPFDQAWQSQVNLLWLVKGRWTERQRRMFRMYSQTGLQDDVAKRLNISQQTVSKTLKSIDAAQVQALEKTLAEWTAAEFTK